MALPLQAPGSFGNSPAFQPDGFDHIDDQYGGSLNPPAPPPDQTIDLTPQPQNTMVDGAMVQDYGPQSGALVDFAPGQSQSPMGDMLAHDANLAEFLDEQTLRTIAEDLLEKIDHDIQSRHPWEDRYRKGLEVLGVVPEADDDEIFPGASMVNYPLLGEAVTQFNARALPELFPSTGPVKAKPVMDEPPQEVRDQAERVENHMNFQVTVEDEGHFAEKDRLLFLLPVTGSMFTKVYRDTLLNRNLVRMVRPEDLMVAYTAADLDTAPRVTHRYYLYPHKMAALQRDGYFVQTKLIAPDNEDDTVAGLRDIYDQADSRAADAHEDDWRHTEYECHSYYDLPGFEDQDPMTGEPTGIPLPYIITIDLLTRATIRITRNWKETDQLRKKRAWFSHYKFFPGTGFYGFGYLHMIGGLSAAATETLRALLDSAAVANMQGGFKSKDLKITGGDNRIAVGQWKDVDATAEDMAKGFYTPPYKEPSAALFQLFGMLVDAGRAFTSTNENMVGDADNKGPVGTTVALIEQGSKVYSTIHLRLHNAAGGEFKILAELTADFIPPEGYPYSYKGMPQQAMASDYDDRIDIIPVSDPNIISQTMRIAMAQATLQLAEQAPDLYDMRAVHKRMHEAMRTPDVDEILKNPTAPPPHMDPVSENMGLLTGVPVTAYPDQAHDAHLKVHGAFMMHPGFGGNPEVQGQIGQPLMAHMGEHLAYLYRERVMQSMGLQLPPADLHGGQGGPVTQPLPPDVENQIAIAAAQAMQQFQQMAGLDTGMGPQDPNQAAFQADEQRKQTAFESDQKRADEKHKQGLEHSSAKEGAALDNKAFGLVQGAQMDQGAAQLPGQGAEATPAEMSPEVQQIIGDLMQSEQEKEQQIQRLAQEFTQMQSMLAMLMEQAKANQGTAQGMVELQTAMAELSRHMTAPRKLVRDPETNQLTGYTIGE